MTWQVHVIIPSCEELVKDEVERPEQMDIDQVWRGSSADDSLDWSAINKNSERETGVQPEDQKGKAASHWLLPRPQSEKAQSCLQEILEWHCVWDLSSLSSFINLSSSGINVCPAGIKGRGNPYTLTPTYAYRYRYKCSLSFYTYVCVHTRSCTHTHTHTHTPTDKKTQQ